MSLCARLIALQALVVALVLTRWPLKPDWLLTFDNANFAFALDDFNPALHKPQPPGYPLFVGLSRFIHYYVNDAVTVFFIAGFIGTLIAVLALARLAREAGGSLAGVAAAALLIVHPALWAAELMNPVRVYLATGSAAVALLAWNAMKPGAHWGWLTGAGAVLGIASGFRPTLVVLMAPLLMYAAWRGRAKPTACILSMVALGVTTAAWVFAAASSVGGIEAYLKLLTEYVDEQSETTSLLFGAPLEPALKMAGRALMWSFVPCLIWILMIPFTRRSELVQVFKQAGPFLLIWIAPPLLFYMLVHSAEPGHLMPVVVPACFAGALVISTLRRSTVAITASALAGVALFLLPPNGVMTLSSLRAVRWSERNVSEGLSLIRDLRNRGRVTVVAAPSSAIAWRLLSYYQSHDPVIVLLSDPQADTGQAPADYWIVRGGSLAGKGSGPVPLPETGKIVWFLTAGIPPPTSDKGPLAYVKAGPAIVTDAAPNTTVTLGNFRFVSGAAPTAAVLVK